MKKWRSLRYVAAAGILFLSISCATTVNPHGQPHSAEKPIAWEDTLFAWKAKIDYTVPSKYLAAGPLTRLSAENRDIIESTLSWDMIEDKSWSLVDGIYRYMLDKEHFTPINADGAMIAKRSADRIFAEKTLTGCHDWGIVLAATLRAFGIPAIYIDAASVAWALKYASAENASPFFVHVFIEAWIDDRWVLLNSTRPEAILRHDVTASLIEFHVNDSSPYYVMFKGLDPLDYGLRSADDMRDSMVAASKTIVKSGEISSGDFPILSVPGLARKKRLIAKAKEQRQF